MALQRACACGRLAGAPTAWSETRMVSPDPGWAPLPGAETWASWGRDSSLNPSGPGVAVETPREEETSSLGGTPGLSALCPSTGDLCSCYSFAPSLLPAPAYLPPHSPLPLFQALKQELIHSGCSLCIEGFSSLSLPCKCVIFQVRVQTSLPQQMLSGPP